MIHHFGVREGRIGLNRMVELLCTNPAKLFGLYPRKGTIAVGSDADIMIFDTEKEHVFTLENQHMNVDYCAYEGKKVKGKVETVLSRGRVVIENGEYKGQPGDGRFLKRGTCAAM